MTGTTSNIEGDFVLECAVGDTLTVSFVGYQDRSVLVKSGNIYAIALKESAAELGEVVVTAFGQLLFRQELGDNGCIVKRIANKRVLPQMAAVDG